MGKKNRKKKKEIPPEKKKASLGKKLLLSFCTVAILLAIGECSCRRFFPDNPESRWNQHHFRVDALGFSELNAIMERDHDLFWRVKPQIRNQHLVGTVGTEELLSFRVTTDENGLRVMEDSDAEENILFLGDSCTFGIGVEAKETCAARVAEALGVKAHNLSCPGYTLYQGLKLLERVGWEPKPKAVVVAFGFNDRLMWDGLTDPDQGAVLSHAPSFLARHSRLFYCVEHAFVGSLRHLKRKTGEKTRRVPPELFLELAKDLVDQARERTVPVIFLFWPRIEWMKVKDSNHPYGGMLAEMVDHKTVAIVDLAEAFRNNGKESLYIDGIHARPEGHRLAAQEVLATLKAMGAAAGK